MNERHRRKRLDGVRFVLAVPRSVWLNFRLLPAGQAWRLPLLVSHRTRLPNLSGRIEIRCGRLRAGLVKIGFNTAQPSDFGRDRTQLNLRGLWVVEGDCAIGAGTSVEVAEGGVLTTGSHTNIGPRSLIVCHSAITFGEGVLTSWNCTFMDTDQHRLEDLGGCRTNADRPIAIGSSCWIGCHSIVVKGTRLPDFTTVGAGSAVHGQFEEEHTVIAGNPAGVVARGRTFAG